MTDTELIILIKFIAKVLYHVRHILTTEKNEHIRIVLSQLENDIKSSEFIILFLPEDYNEFIKTN